MPAQDVVAGSSVTGYAISRDFYGNFIANVAATWSLSSSTGGVVAGDLVAAGDTKSATFTGHLVGTATVNADDGTFNGDSGLLTVTPGATSTLVVAGFTDPTTAGASHSFTRHGQGRLRQHDPGLHRHGPLHELRRPGRPAGRLHLHRPADAGSHTFSATLKTAGEPVDHRDRHGRPPRSPAARPRITVNPAATSTLVVAGFTDPTTAGDSHSFTRHGQGRLRQHDPGYTGTVHFTSSDVQAVLPADYTFTGPAATRGSHTFSATLKTAGEQSITATDTADRLDHRQPDRHHGQPGRDLDPGRRGLHRSDHRR